MRVRGNSLSFSGASDKVFWKNGKGRAFASAGDGPCFAKYQRRDRRRRGTGSVPGMLTPSRHCDSRAFHARQSRRILESGSLAPPPAALRRFPTFSFVLAKDKVNCPKGKRGAPGGKRAAPGTKENRLFIGLLVRPAKMGLVSSSCAKRRALPVRLRRSYIAYAESLVQIGLLSATAPLPLSGQKKSVYAPAGRNLLRMPGLAAAAQEGPRVLFAPSILHPMSQMRPKRHGSAGQ